jgi:hypothetical protein
MEPSKAFLTLLFTGIVLIVGGAFLVSIGMNDAGWALIGLGSFCLVCAGIVITFL